MNERICERINKRLNIAYCVCKKDWMRVTVEITTEIQVNLPIFIVVALI